MNSNIKKRKTNPFEILGLSPKIVKELDEESLYKLVRAIYRVLQMIYHPDRGGDPNKALEINLAFELLNLEKNPESFKEYRKKYIERLSRKTLQTKIENLEIQNRKLNFYNQLLKEKFWQFLKNDFEALKDLFKQNKGFRLKIFDVVSYFNFSHLRRIKKQMFFKDLILYEDFVLIRGSYEKFFKKILNYKYIGTIKREYIEPWVLLERSLREEAPYLKNFIKENIFIKECLIFLNFNIEPNSYIFFYDFKNTQKIVLEGVVIKLEEIPYPEILEILKKETVKSKDKKDTDNILNQELLEI
ncbi:J domain-containing protein [Thermodesulfobacterium hydrogeniphilum]|uniref:J domain-containing protein n=1 Tax=Thermodesulfobacterium hydrogeniphilum TaxID=161156 RepID=UPI00056F26D2|nr:J domain-containing protein [Thermodesulfobacterium hydrogeniphilum]